MGRRLTLKQQLFVEAYIGKANGNATESARIAGYKGSENVLGVIALENLRKPKIAELIEKRVGEAAMSADDVLNELAKIAKCDWKDFVDIQYDKDGEPIKALLKLSDKIKSLELLGKHHKLFTEKHEVEASVSMSIDEFNKQADERLRQAEKAAKKRK